MSCASDNRVRPCRRPRAAAASLVAVVEVCEARRLLALVPTTYEQYLLELINRARADPAAEASRLHISLNEGLPAGTISADAKQPLAMDGALVQSIRNHLVWLRTNGKFQHEGSGGSTPQQRMSTAGYNFGTGASGSAENLGLSLAANTGDVAAHVTTLYQNLFTDGDIAGRGHRINLLNGSMREVANAEEEGVTFEWLAAPRALSGEAEAVTGVRAIRMRLGAPDASGRQSPEEIPGGDFDRPAQLVLKALGFEPENLPETWSAPDLKVTRWGTIKADFRSHATSLPGVFAAGDIVRGASLVVWAIRDGREAAESILTYLASQEVVAAE